MSRKGLWPLPEPCGHSLVMGKGHLSLPLARSLPRCPPCTGDPFTSLLPGSQPAWTEGRRAQGHSTSSLALGRNGEPSMWSLGGTSCLLWAPEYLEPSERGLA